MKQSKIHIALINPKTPQNVGSVPRAAGCCYGADAVFYTGSRYSYAAKYNTDTKNIIETLALKHVADIEEAKASGMNLVCVELVEGAAIRAS